MLLIVEVRWVYERLQNGAGKMNGFWKFYRIDSSVMRTGSFKNGEQSGTWTTYAANGRVVKETQF